jgi:hypothetical protein
MKRSLLTILFVLLHVVVLHAQLPSAGESPIFKEPGSGYARVLKMKNGHTIFVQITPKDGIYVDIYDESYKPVVQTHESTVFGNLKGSCVNAIFEANGDIVVFISEVETRQPILYRIILDGRSGRMKRDEKLAETMRYPYLDQPFIPEYKPVSSFFIRKDPNSDNYAMVMLHANDKSVKANLEVIWYNGTHKEISRAYYQSKESPFKNINYLDMAVFGEDQVCLIAYIFNQTSAGDKKGAMIMATLRRDADTLIVDRLNVGVRKVIDSGLVKINPVTKKIMFLGYAHAEAGDTEKYAGIMGIIDPYRKTPEQEIDIYPAKADAKKKALAKKAFTGAPQQLFIHKDGGFSVVYEELTRKVVTPLNSAPYSYCTLDWISVGSFDVTGKPLYECVVPRSQELQKYDISAFNADRVASGAQPLIKGEQFRTAAFFQHNDKVYVMMNNTETNLEKGAKGKPHDFRGVNDTKAYYYECDGSNELPAYKPVFKTDSTVNHSFIPGVCAYDEEKGRLIILKMDKKSDQKGMRVVWLRP